MTTQENELCIQRVMNRQSEQTIKDLKAALMQSERENFRLVKRQECQTEEIAKQRSKVEELKEMLKGSLQHEANEREQLKARMLAEMLAQSKRKDCKSTEQEEGAPQKKQRKEQGTSVGEIMDLSDFA